MNAKPFSGGRPLPLSVLFAFWLLSLLLVAASIWAITEFTPKLRRLSFSHDLPMMWSGALLLLLAAIINLSGWTRLSYSWSRLDIARFNLVLIGAVLIWFAILAWLSVAYGWGPDRPPFIYKLYVTAGGLFALALFSWSLAFLIPKRLHFLLLLLLLLIFAASLPFSHDLFGRDLKFGILYKEKHFLARSGFLTFSFAYLLGMLTVPALVAGWLQKPGKTGSAPRKRLAKIGSWLSRIAAPGTGLTRKKLGIGFAVWASILVLYLLAVYQVSMIEAPLLPNSFRIGLLVVGTIVPLITGFIVFFNGLFGAGEKHKTYGAAASAAAIIGALLLWIFTINSARIWLGLIALLPSSRELMAMTSLGFPWLGLAFAIDRARRPASWQLLLLATLGLFHFLMFFFLVGTRVLSSRARYDHEMMANAVWPLSMMLLIALFLGWREQVKADDAPKPTKLPFDMRSVLPLVLIMAAWAALAIPIAKFAGGMTELLGNFALLITIILLSVWHNWQYWFGLYKAPAAASLARLNGLKIGLVILAVVAVYLGLKISGGRIMSANLPPLPFVLLLAAPSVLMLATVSLLGERLKAWNAVLAALSIIPLAIHFLPGNIFLLSEPYHGRDPFALTYMFVKWLLAFLVLAFLCSLWAAWREGRKLQGQQQI